MGFGIALLLVGVAVFLRAPFPWQFTGLVFAYAGLIPLLERLQEVLDDEADAP